MKTINNRTDLERLVEVFYNKIQTDDILGDIFNSHIAEDGWEEHQSKLTDFWETNLFGEPKFKGNPTKKHLDMDEKLNHKVEQMHFGKWLQLWFETIDELYEGEIANQAKKVARKMATGQFITIWKNRSIKLNN